MDQLIKVLDRKNLCFRSFHKLCLDFLDEIAKGDTSNLEAFQAKREGIIKVLEQLEKDVAACLDAIGTDPEVIEARLTREAKTRITQLLNEKDGLVKQILDLDLQILAHIDRIKDETIQKLQSVQSGRRTVSAYKSPITTVETAEDPKILDREA